MVCVSSLECVYVSALYIDNVFGGKQNMWQLSYNLFGVYLHLITFYNRERSGSVVECFTRDRGVAGSSLTGVTALWSLSKTHLS